MDHDLERCSTSWKRLSIGHSPGIHPIRGTGAVLSHSRHLCLIYRSVSAAYNSSQPMEGAQYIFDGQMNKSHAGSGDIMFILSPNAHCILPFQVIVLQSNL